ncbi:MAG: SMC family ATPase [Chloroflexi bacterium]|nr:SMC family ATPase [Chloroflexota bacterium]
MRPLRIELEGFTAFREKVCIDFRELDLFAITGPTGAGKSSLIDAIAYALYGRVPRVGTSIGACISQGLARMWVQLEFAAGEERYRVFRETKKTGQRAIRLDRYEAEDWKPINGGASQVNAQIEKIVGLDFDGFIRSVLLPQDQFQEFLAGDPAKRREVLAGLLQLDVYEGIRKRASDRARELHARVQTTEQMLQTVYAEVSPEAIQESKSQFKSFGAQEATLGARIAELSSARDLARSVAQARGQLDQLRTQLRDVTAKQQETGALVAEGDAQIQGLAEQLRAADAAICANSFDPDQLAALTIAVRLYRQLAESTQSVARAQEEARDHELTERACVTQEASLSAQLLAMDIDSQVALAAIEAAGSANAAAVVQRGLRDGESCPVCGGRIGELPHIDCADLDEAQGRLAEIRTAQKLTESALAQVRAKHQVAATKHEQAQRREDDLAGQVATLSAELTSTLPDGDWSADTAATELARQQDAQRAATKLNGERANLQQAMQTLADRLTGAQAGLDALGGQKEALQDSATRSEGELQDHIAALRDLARGTEWGEQLAGLDAGSALERAIQSSLQESETARREAQTRMGQLGQRIEDLQGKLEQKQQFQHDLGALGKKFDVADDLAKIMQANRFGAFVQSEALQLLAEGGSRVLETLSASRYRLQIAANGQEFEVVDTWNGDETRSVKTLSGGETFLASLALALTMAESLPGLAASQRIVLDSIIIDEGFGSLDPEALDRAADALDALRAQNRMVCVITHLKELAERMPARIEVIKSESGSRVEVRS